MFVENNSFSRASSEIEKRKINNMSDLSISQIKSFQDYLDRAEFYQNRGEFDSAIDCYRSAIQINPHNAIAYYYLGNIYFNLDRQSEAKDFYRKALKINPKFDRAYYSLGEVYSQLQQWESAIIAYQQALNLNSNLPDLYKKLANAFYQRASLDKESLLTTYQKKIQYDPYEIKNYHQAKYS